MDGVPQFCESLSALTKPGGGVVISTINRTQRSYALAIIAAEYVLGLVPKGTHDWQRFITPGAALASSVPHAAGHVMGGFICMHARIEHSHMSLCLRR